MTRKDGTTTDPAARVTRIAWVFSFAIPLVLLVLLCVAMPAHALGAIESPPPGPTEPAPEDEAETEVVAEECVEEEAEEGEISEDELEAACEEPGKAGDILPEGCLLRTFRPQLVANAAGNAVQLTIRYTTFKPIKATVGYGLKSLHLGTAQFHLGKRGVLHLARHLSDSQMIEVRESHKATVQVRVPSAPSRCDRYYSTRLTARHGSAGRVTFAPRRNG
jgi:hypothetical protein